MAKRKAPRTAFKKGNPGGPGRPPRRVEDSYMTATIATVSIEDWRDIVRQAVNEAKGGLNTHHARQWLSQYLLSDKAFAAKLYGQQDTTGGEIAQAFRDLINARRTVDAPREDAPAAEPAD